jgi:hypothetical protein
VIIISQSSIQWDAFVTETIQNKKVWAIRDKEGFPTSTNQNGECSMPFWSSTTKAKKIIENVPAYSNFTIHEIPLHDFMDNWLIGLDKDGLFVGVNWGGTIAVGYDIKPTDVLTRLIYELQKTN